MLIDGAQGLSHGPVDVQALDCDFYAFSGHKMYGPTGIGVLWVKAERLSELSPVKFGGGMIREVTIEKTTWANSPEKYEGGTPPIAEAIGLGKAIDFIESIGWEEIEKKEKEVGEYALEQLTKLSWIKILGPNTWEDRVGVIAISSTGEMNSPHDIADILGRRHMVCVRGGHHCTMPLHHKFGVETGTIRASLGVYNTKEDIDKLIEGLKEAEEIIKQMHHER